MSQNLFKFDNPELIQMSPSNNFKYLCDTLTTETRSAPQLQIMSRFLMCRISKRIQSPLVR